MMNFRDYLMENYSKQELIELILDTLDEHHNYDLIGSVDYVFADFLFKNIKSCDELKEFDIFIKDIDEKRYKKLKEKLCNKEILIVLCDESGNVIFEKVKANELQNFIENRIDSHYVYTVVNDIKNLDLATEFIKRK